jgi:Type III restriction enzyme, res subunit
MQFYPENFSMNKLSKEAKNRLITNAESVYFGYLRLEFLNNHPIKIGNETTTLANYIKEKVLNNQQLNPTIIPLGKRNIKVAVTDEGKVILTSINDITTSHTNTIIQKKIKSLTEYNDDDIAELLLGSYTLHDNKTFSTEIKGQNSKSYEIGGTNKISLYRLHISNLGRIIQHLRSPHSDKNMLVSLTTGSGKTFTQALWIMVLYMSQVNGVFALPSQRLFSQFQDDLRRLIPDAMLKEIQDPQSSITIDVAENILLKEEQFAKLSALDPKNTLISFDEAHLLALKENLFVKAKALADKFINLYLTATPTPALYKIAEGDSKQQELIVVATMNNEQKVKNGYAERAVCHSASAKSITDIDNNLHLTQMEKMSRWLVDSIDPQTSYNSANAFAEAYLYNVAKKAFFGAEKMPLPNLSPYKKLRLAVRWSLQLSAFQGKTLVCANHFEDIVNLDLFLKQMLSSPNTTQSDNTQPAADTSTSLHTGSVPTMASTYYTNANLFNRNETYQFLQMSQNIDGEEKNADTSIYDGYARGLHQQFKKKLSLQIKQLAKELNITVNSADEEQNIADKLAEEMMAGLPCAPITNSMHGVVELTLSVLAALAHDQEPNLNTLMQEFGGAYLDRQRFTKLSQFTKKIATVINKLSSDQTLESRLCTLLTYDKDKNTKGLEPKLAIKLASIMTQLINQFPTLADKERFVDNWYADQTLLNQLSGNVKKELYLFANENYKQFVFEKIEKNETIVPNEVFTTFKESVHTIGIVKDENQEDDPAYKPKPRAKRAVEALNPYAKESLFHPNVLPVKNDSAQEVKKQTEQRLEKADNLFHLGITTIYGTDKKVEGFNDPNLHQVSVLTHSNENTLANPANMIQAYGRNRGLNPYKVPQFLHVSQKGVKCLFGVPELSKADYQKDYDKAMEGFKQNYIKKLGQELGDEILLWIEINKDAFHEVDDEKLSAAVIEKCFTTLEKLNQVNAYKFKLTQKDYTQVLNFAIGHLKQKQQTLKTGTTLPLLVRVVAILMHTFAKILRWFAAKEPKKQLKELTNQFAYDLTDEDSRVANLHYKITNIPLESVWEHDLSHKIILMNLVNEGKSLYEIRDKYYSALFLKPLNILSKSNKAEIKSKHPELKIILEGLFSYIALMTEANKEQYLTEIATVIASNDKLKISALFAQLKSVPLNENHPKKAQHLSRLRMMLSTIGYKPVPDEFNNVVDLIKKDDNFASKLVQTVAKNHDGLKCLRFDEEQGLNYINYLKKQIVGDIKKLVFPLISDPAYINILKFIKDNFNETELATIYHENSDTVNFLVTFIDACKGCDKDEFYERYFLPAETQLMDGPFDLANLPIILVNQLIEGLFKIVHESNLRFYKVTDQGQVKVPKIEEKFFFTTREINNPTSRVVVDDYDVRLLKAPDEELRQQTIYIQLNRSRNAVAKITQVNVHGEQKVLTGNFADLNDIIQKISRIQGSAKNSLTFEDLQVLNRVVMAAGGETLFSPSVSDEKTELGELWRQIFGLQSLKTALPTINRITYKMKGKEIEKSVEVSSKLLEKIIDRNVTNTADNLINHASCFSKILMEEAKEKQEPCYEGLGNKSSRVEKMKATFQQNIEHYRTCKISEQTKDELIRCLEHYLSSRAVYQKVNNVYIKTNLKSKLLFNMRLTEDKVDLAIKFLNKLNNSSKIGNNYSKILQLIEKTIEENNQLIEKHGLNPAKKNGLNSVLNSIKEILVKEMLADSSAKCNSTTRQRP